MDAYSLDLRRRVVAAVDAGEDKGGVARRFCVSRQWVNKLLRQRRDTGSIAPREYRRGRRPKVSGESERALRRAVEKAPDATPDELRRACGTAGGVMSVWRALRRLRITVKKSPCTPASGTRPRSGSGVPRGGGRRRGSSRGTSCSSTRAGRART